MKGLISALLIATIALPALVIADTYVQGYTRKDGTYVQPHYRSSPDGSYNNNWSVQPNVNPYTGKPGTLQPTWNDRPPRQGGFSTPYGTPYYQRK